MKRGVEIIGFIASTPGSDGQLFHYIIEINRWILSIANQLDNRLMFHYQTTLNNIVNVIGLNEKSCYGVKENFLFC